MRGVAMNFDDLQGVRVAAISAAISERERNTADRQKACNPRGDSYFGRFLRWFDSQSPFQGFSCLTALDSAKIASRATYPIYEIACN